jgi:TRAP-type C4-dicarboxylate transport system substrate-binding protein
MKGTAMTRIWILGALIAITAVASGCLGGDDSDKAGGEPPSETTVLTLANPDDGTFDLDQFASEVESQSNGSIQIQFENNWRAGETDNEPSTINDVRDGEADLGSVGARAFDLVGVDDLQPLVAPFAIDSYALEREVLSSPVAARMLRGVERAGVVGVALLPGEMRNPLGISRPLVEASDYRGATIGAAPSELSARTFEAMGASSKAYRFSDDLSSFDGLEAHAGSIEGERYDEAARTLAANVNLWPRVLTIVMNRDAYAALTDDQREALSAAGRAALDRSLDDIQGGEREAMGVLCNRGQVAVRLASPSQLDALHAAVNPVTRALNRDPTTKEAMREIAAMRAAIDPEPAFTCAADDGDQAAGTAGSATPLDGLWEMETTAKELADADPEGLADVVPENWGRQTFALEGGRFAFTNENREACIWGYGTYAVEDEIVEFEFDDGGGEQPTGASNRPGELFRYGWSLYRDQLTLTPVKGAISPANFRVEPWRRLDGEPSVDALSSGCPPPADALEP